MNLPTCRADCRLADLADLPRLSDGRQVGKIRICRKSANSRLADLAEKSASNPNEFSYLDEKTRHARQNAYSSILVKNSRLRRVLSCFRGVFIKTCYVLRKFLPAAQSFKKMSRIFLVRKSAKIPICELTGRFPEGLNQFKTEDMEIKTEAQTVFLMSSFVRIQFF
jgi:hypothetical protein